MNSFVEQIFLREIMYQCAQGLDAAQRALDEIHVDPSPEAIMAALDDIIDHSSRVALLLWPIPGRRARNEDEAATNERRAARGEHLRSVLSIEDDHITKNRKLRDHLHHFDERIDEMTSGERIVFVDSCIGPKSMFLIDGQVPTTMRHFDPATSTYHFQTEEYNISDLVNGLENVRDRTEKRLLALR